MGGSSKRRYVIASMVFRFQWKTPMFRTFRTLLLFQVRQTEVSFPVARSAENKSHCNLSSDCRRKIFFRDDGMQANLAEVFFF